MVLAFAMATVTLLTGLITPEWSSISIFILCGVFGATGAAWNGIYLAEITRHVATEDVSRATGGGLFVTFFGVVVAPPIFGLIINLTNSFETAYIALGSATMLIGLLLLKNQRKLGVNT